MALRDSVKFFIYNNIALSSVGSFPISNNLYKNSLSTLIPCYTCRVIVPCVAGEVGLVVETMGGADAVVGGTLPQRVASCLEALGALLARPHAVAASMVLADKRRAGAAQLQDVVSAVANILGEHAARMRTPRPPGTLKKRQRVNNNQPIG